MDDYEVLPGIREVQFSQFTEMGPLSYYSASEKARTQALAAQIRASRSIEPLIVVVDEKGPYILEGGHRFDALRELGVKSLPAMVVMDHGAASRPPGPVMAWAIGNCKFAQQQYFDFYKPEEYVPVQDPGVAPEQRWPDPGQDPISALSDVINEMPHEVESFLRANSGTYDPQVVSFGDADHKPPHEPVIVVIPSNPHVVELGDYPEAKPAAEWLSDVDDMYLGYYVPYHDFNKDFWDEVGAGSTMYHATDPDNVKSIMSKGLSPDSKTRGMSNRSMGSAVFTSHEPTSISSYGDAVIEIDVGRMKADGYMPQVSQEEPFEDERMRAALACKIGLDDYCPYSEYASEGLDQATVAFFGAIPPKYLRTNWTATASWASRNCKFAQGAQYVRYVHRDGSGLMNNAGLDRTRLSDDEESELVDLMDLGLQQPRGVPGGTIFAFTQEGAFRHARLVKLLSKASRTGVRKLLLDSSGYEVVWQTDDGQVALVPSSARRASKFAQVAKVSIDPSPAQDALNTQVAKVAPMLEERAEMSARPVDFGAHIAAAEKGLQSIRDQSKRAILEGRALQALRSSMEARDPEQVDAARNEIVQVIQYIMSNFRGAEWGEARGVYKALIDADEHVSAQGETKGAEQMIGEYRSYLTQDLTRGMAQAQDLKAKIEQFMAVTGSQARVILYLRPGADEFGTPAFFPMDFTLDMLFPGTEESLEPNMTIFTDENGGLHVDDVLSWGDTDFFGDEAQSRAYFQLVEFLRTGKMPGQGRGGTIRLYRGMSPREYAKWENGDAIPAGKYFTSRATAEYAQDISGEPPELFSFLVDRDVVFETSPGEFQTAVESRLQGRRIVPGSTGGPKHSSWVRRNCKFAQKKRQQEYTDVGHATLKEYENRASPNVLWIFYNGTLLTEPEMSPIGGPIIHEDIWEGHERMWRGRYDPRSGSLSMVGPNEYSSPPSWLVDMLRQKFSPKSIRTY